MSKDDRLKYFKDETWGTSDIFVSGGKARRSVGLRTLVKRAKELVESVENGNPNPSRVDFAAKVEMEVVNGLEWCREVLKTVDDFLREHLLGSLKQIIPILEENAAASSTSTK